MKREASINQPPVILIDSNDKGISKKEFEDHKKDTDFQKNTLNWTFGFIVAIVIVCVISFVTFIVDAWNLHSNTYKEYNQTIQELKQENTTLKLNEIKIKMEYLEKNQGNFAPSR